MVEIDICSLPNILESLCIKAPEWMDLGTADKVGDLMKIVDSYKPNAKMAREAMESYGDEIAHFLYDQGLRILDPDQEADPVRVYREAVRAWADWAYALIEDHDLHSVNFGFPQ